MLTTRRSCFIVLGVLAFGQSSCSYITFGHSSRTRPRCPYSDTPVPTNAEIAFERLDGSSKVWITVVDGCSNEPLIGCPVQLASTALGALTNVDGQADINNPPPGVYELDLKMIGYYPVKLLNVVVLPGYISNLGTIAMDEAPSPKIRPIGHCGPSWIDFHSID